jgi:hypothetical protein
MTQMQAPEWQSNPEQDPRAAAKASKAYAKASRPAYKKKRFIIPAALVAIAAISNAGGSDNSATTKPAAVEKPAADAAPPAAPAAEAPAPAAAAPAPAPAPAPAEAAVTVSAAELIETLEGNALNAKKTWDGKQVNVTGFVGSIDASGDYFSLLPEPGAMVFTGVQVYTSEKFLDQVASFSEGQAVTVTGKIDDVGEIMGYSLKAKTIS